VRARIARRIAKGEQLLEIGVVKPGRGFEFAPRGLLEHFAHPHQSARKCPFSARRTAAQLDQVSL
jgi:hypothetical protein